MLCYRVQYISVLIKNCSERLQKGLYCSYEGHPSAAWSYLVLWHDGEGLDDGCQGHLALLGELGGAGEGVGGAAHEPGTGVT